MKKFLKILFMIPILIGFMNSVYAIPTGEIYSETTSSNITLLSKFQYADGEVRLYGRSGSGQTSPFIPSLNEFRDGNYSLFTYQSIPSGNRTSFGMNFYLDKTLMSGKSYTSTFKVAGNPGTIEYYFSNPYSITNANLNSKSVTCLTGSCFINTTFTMSSSTNELHIDFSPTEGLNGQIFVDIFTGIFMTQVEEYNYLDTSGLQNNQQIIINQNDQIINNNNQNTQDIISSSGSNTQSIIDNQNENSNKEIESQKVCTIYDKAQVKISGRSLTNSGGLVDNSAFSTSDYIKINNNDTITILSIRNNNPFYCLYDTNKSLISCNNSYQLNQEITLSSNVSYFRYSIQVNENKPTFKICKNGNQAIDDSLNDLNDNITSTDTSSANSSANSFFNNFNNEDFGLSDIITLPLNFIKSLTSSSCQPLQLTVPFVNKELNLPCMSEIYSQFFGSFYSLYQTITFGMVAYWVAVKILALVKGFKDPDNDKIEVVDL